MQIRSVNEVTNYPTKEERNSKFYNAITLLSRHKKTALSAILIFMMLLKSNIARAFNVTDLPTMYIAVPADTPPMSAGYIRYIIIGIFVASLVALIIKLVTFKGVKEKAVSENNEEKIRKLKRNHKIWITVCIILMVVSILFWGLWFIH